MAKKFNRIILARGTHHHANVILLIAIHLHCVFNDKVHKLVEPTKSANHTAICIQFYWNRSSKLSDINAFSIDKAKNETTEGDNSASQMSYYSNGQPKRITLFAISLFNTHAKESYCWQSIFQNEILRWITFPLQSSLQEIV